MPIKSSALSGPTHQMALAHPFVSPEREFYQGVMLGINVRSHRVVYVDPWLLKSQGVIHSTYGMLLGPKDTGKSATLKMIAMRMFLIAAGYSIMRVVINDYKPEGKDSEYAAFSNICRSKIFTMRDMSVNPFEPQLFIDPRMTESDKYFVLGMMQMAKIMTEFAKNEPLTAIEYYALRVAMSEMIRRPELMWSPFLLQRIAGSLTEEMVAFYQDSIDGKLIANTTKRLTFVKSGDTKAEVEASLRELTGTSWNYSIADVQRAGVVISALLGNILQGSYGHMFGDSHSLYDMLTQRAVTKDWRGLDPEGESLMRIIDTTIRTTAAELNRVDMLPHIEIDDEKHRSMDNLAYARTHSFFSEIARGMHTLSLGGTHSFDSIRKGSVGSELYNLGDRIIRNTGFVLYGKQPDEPKILDEIRRREGLSEADTRLLTRLPRYVFGLKFGENEPMQFIRIIATPMDLRDLIGSNSAAERMVNRPSVFSPEDLARYAQENGIQYIGMPG